MSGTLLLLSVFFASYLVKIILSDILKLPLNKPLYIENYPPLHFNPFFLVHLGLYIWHTIWSYITPLLNTFQWLSNVLKINSRIFNIADKPTASNPAYFEILILLIMIHSPCHSPYSSHCGLIQFLNAFLLYFHCLLFLTLIPWAMKLLLII